MQTIHQTEAVQYIQKTKQLVRLSGKIPTRKSHNNSNRFYLNQHLYHECKRSPWIQ